MPADQSRYDPVVASRRMSKISARSAARLPQVPDSSRRRAAAEVARFLLESTAADLDEVSQSSGFGNPAALRHHLRRRVGLTPTAYRASFKAT